MGQAAAALGELLMFALNLLLLHAHVTGSGQQNSSLSTLTKD